MSYNNSFSSSKKVIPGHNFWGGKVKCIYCSNELKGFVKIKPIKNDRIDFVFDWNGKQCSAIGPNKTSGIKRNIYMIPPIKPT